MASSSLIVKVRVPLDHAKLLVLSLKVSLAISLLMIGLYHTANLLEKIRQKGEVMSHPLKMLRMHGHLLKRRANQHPQRLRLDELRPSMEGAGAHHLREGMR